MAAPNEPVADAPPGQSGGSMATDAGFDPANATTAPQDMEPNVGIDAGDPSGGGERGGEPRRGRRRGRRGRRGGGPRDAAAAGDAAFTPGEPDAAGAGFPGDDDGTDDASAPSQAANGHAGNGADLPFPEPPRFDSRSGAISWTGLAAPEAPVVVAAEPIVVEVPQASPAPQIDSNLSAPTSITPADAAALEDSGIDTAKLPKLETPDEPTAQLADVPAIDSEANQAAASHADEAPLAAAEPASAPAPPPARVVWSSGPAAPAPQDRGRED